MNELMKKIFEEIVCYEEETISRNRAIDTEVLHIVKRYKGKLNGEERETLQDQFCDLALLAEREGFYLGMRFALRVLMELHIM